MKKLSIILLIGISCALMLYVVLLLIADKSACTKFGKKRIALFTPATHPALEEIEQGFKETLQKLHSDSFIFTSFNAMKIWFVCKRSKPYSFNSVITVKACICSCFECKRFWI